MIRGIDQEIAKLPYEQQPGAYKVFNCEWDERTLQQLYNVLKFSEPLTKDLELFMQKQ